MNLPENHLGDEKMEIISLLKRKKAKMLLYIVLFGLSLSISIYSGLKAFIEEISGSWDGILVMVLVISIFATIIFFPLILKCIEEIISLNRKHKGTEYKKPVKIYDLPDHATKVLLEKKSEKSWYYFLLIHCISTIFFIYYAIDYGKDISEIIVFLGCISFLIIALITITIIKENIRSKKEEKKKTRLNLQNFKKRNVIWRAGFARKSDESKKKVSKFDDPNNYEDKFELKDEIGSISLICWLNILWTLAYILVMFFLIFIPAYRNVSSINVFMMENIISLSFWGVFFIFLIINCVELNSTRLILKKLRIYPDDL